MIKTKMLIIFLGAVIFVSGAVYAQDTSYDTGKGRTYGKERSLQHRSTADIGSSTEVRLSIDSVFVPILAEYEKKDKTFKTCSIISKPKLPADFGLSTASPGGGYDLIKGQYFDQQAKSGGQAPAGLTKYRNCMAFYGAVIAQSYLNLTDMLPTENISLDDLQTLAIISVEKTLTEGFRGNVKKLYGYATRNNIPCRFKQNLDAYLCGTTHMSLSLQKLTLGTTELWGEKFYGYAGDFKVSQSTKKSKELVIAQKKAWDMSRHSKQAVSPSKLLPSIN